MTNTIYNKISTLYKNICYAVLENPQGFYSNNFGNVLGQLASIYIMVIFCKRICFEKNADCKRRLNKCAYIDLINNYI